MNKGENSFICPPMGFLSLITTGRKYHSTLPWKLESICSSMTNYRRNIISERNWKCQTLEIHVDTRHRLYYVLDAVRVTILALLDVSVVFM